jgi:hypothetical protein
MRRYAEHELILEVRMSANLAALNRAVLRAAAARAAVSPSDRSDR